MRPDVANSGYHTIGFAAACNTFSVKRGRVLAFQRHWQGWALACALGWHRDRGCVERCSTHGFADLLHQEQQ
jgi:hypothetical protein